MKNPRTCATAIILLLLSMVLPVAHSLAHTSERGFVMLLPTDYYLAGGMISVALSFCIMALFDADRIARLFRGAVTIPWLPTRWDLPLSAIGFGLIVFLLYCGVEGPRDPLTNLLPLSIWTIGWIGVTIAHAVFGNMWVVLNPWRFPVYVLQQAMRLPATLVALPRGIRYWPALVQLFAIAWYELVDLAPEDPDRLALAVAGYWILGFLGSLLFGVEHWRRYCDPLGVLFGFLSLVAPIATATDENGQRRLTLNWPGTHILSAEPVPFAAMLFVVLSLATVSFDGLNMTFWWLGLNGINPLEFPGRSAVIGLNTFGLLLMWVVMTCAFGATVWIGNIIARTADGVDFESVLGLLVLSLLPISLAYHVSHYLTAFLVNGQWFLVAANDPLGTHANLLGLDQFRVTTSFLNVHDAVERLWQFQVTAIVCGHVLAVILAHGLAIRLHRENQSKTILSQIPLGILMVLYTLFGLWLLSAPTAG